MEGSEVGSEGLNYVKFIYLWYSLINSIQNIIMMVFISHMLSYYVPIHCDVVLLKVYPAEVHLQVYEPRG